MFWAEKIANEVERRYADVIASGSPIIVRDEKTASGPVHVGSLRSAALHAIVADVLTTRGHAVEFFFEINDFDPMDSIPGTLDESTYRPYMGMPLNTIPSPLPSADNFAVLYGEEYAQVLRDLGFEPRVYWGSELYASGKMNNCIRTALEKRDVIRRIYAEVSKSEKPKDWYPISVVCEECGSVSATRVTDFDGETVAYECSSDTIEWAVGCGHSGRRSPFDGGSKFPWKVDWAAKFAVFGVHFEGGGKDHFSKGGARQVADAIAREVFEHEPPYGVFNEFFLIGGKKMSSSKGNAATAVGMNELLPPHMLRLQLLKTPINRQMNFDPGGDSVPTLFDTYDRIAEKTWSGTEDDDSVLFYYTHLPRQRAEIVPHFLPRFSQVAFLVQMPHMDTATEVREMKGAELTDADREELQVRERYATLWLDGFADERFIYALQESVPEAAGEVGEEEKAALAQLADAIEAADTYDGQALHTLIHDVKEESGLSPKEFFRAIYLAFLGKESGPKAGWFLSTLDRQFVIDRLRLTK